MSTSNHAPELQTPLLYDIVDDSVDHKGRPVYRFNSGGWRSAGFIIGVEVAERFAYYGISSNLITYLTGPLGQSTATAAENVNMWAGTATLLPILGAFVADSFLGRYTTIIVASLIYILGLGLLTLSALLSTHTATDLPCSPPPFQLILFFFALYLVAIGESGHKPCAQAFGADHKNCNRFLNKALLAPNGSKEDGNVCSISDVEEAKALLRLVPIWTSCLVFAVVFAQRSTLFTKQAVTMDRSISHGIDFPAASLQFFMNLSIVLFIPIYDRVFVPLARALTRKPSGITMLQRIGTGIFLSVMTMVIAALVEMKRLKTAQEHGLVDLPDVTIPMSVWWLIPQYVLLGIAESFTMVGLQEFFYDQVPSDLRSVGISLNLCIFGTGNFLSSFLISVIEKATGGNGRYSWFDNNLNRAHLDYFYWLLAGMSVVQMAFYVYSAKSYIYNRRGAV
ncbi:protein NRT1/ PTR FAMILY 5.10-like [Populus nigra]|uniref:protein NRT1/ PTR FAMILY 5.10-like n=1 Tax=Populus nigra TaxID=3691 RepID=UPI002B26C164|nr:protein NRT1/ PTR FAMILY 5.10-like [Populus nigra]